MAQPTPTSNGNGGRLAIFRALNSRNYRLFFAGQLVSLIGTWLTNTTTPWFVYKMTNDTGKLGLVAFTGQIPAFLLAPLAGVLVDRWRLHRVLVVTQTLSMLQSAALVLMVVLHDRYGLANEPTLYGILALYAFQGLVNAFDLPARQSFVIQMVENPADLPNAIALNSSMFNAARFLGPAVGGVLIAVAGAAWCYAIDAVSYLAVIVGLLLMQVPAAAARAGVRKHVLAEFDEGVRYALGFPPIRMLLLLIAFVSLVGVPYMALMPAFAQALQGHSVLLPHLRGYGALEAVARFLRHGAPAGADSNASAVILGLLYASAGAGALIGALVLAARKSVVGLGRLIPMATCGFGMALIAFSFSRVLEVSLPLVALAGFCMVTQMASCNTLIQTIVEHDKRGRIMALFGMCFQGMMPIGALLAGFMAKPQHLQPSRTVAAGGTLCLLAAGVFALALPVLRRHVRPIYVQRGILPEIATGLQSTAAVTSPKD